MRLYHALLVTAVALLASNASAGHADCDMIPANPVEPTSGSAPIDTPVQGSTTSSDVGSTQEVSSASGSAPKDSFDGFDSSNDSPIQQGSTDVGTTQASASGSTPKDSFDGFDASNDSPIHQTSSDVGASHGSAPDTPIQEGSNPDTPIQQGSAPSDASFTSSYNGPTPDFPDYGASQGSATDAPVTQGSDVGASHGSAPESPIQEGSSPESPIQQGSNVGASQASASASASGDDDIKQGIVIPAGTDAPTDEASQKTDVAGEADVNQTTEAPTATTTAPTVASTSGSSSAPATSNNTTSPVTGDNSKLCGKPRIQITDIDVGAAVEANEDEVALKVVAIASLPSGGSRIAFQSGESIIVRELDANDKLVTSSPAVKVPLHDFADLYADEKGFVILGTRDAEGGGTLNCGNPSNLCGSAPSPAVPCYDMYMVRYDGSTETWATKLTSSSSSLPPYSSSKTGPDVYMIWWYAHHGRIAFDGKNWAAYFGAAISTSEGGCINIHQGDRMKVVDPSGKITAHEDSFDWGCSHSGYERITYDNRSSKYAAICKTDSNNRIMPPQDWDTTIYPVDLAASNLGDIVPSAASNKYWATVSNGNGDNAKVHLIHFDLKSKASEDITLGGTDANERAPHLASIGKGGLLAMWEGSSSGGDFEEGGARTIYAQVLDSSTGKDISEKVTVDKSVVGNRYQALKTFPDGSVAYLSKGKTGTSLQVVRFFGC